MNTHADIVKAAGTAEEVATARGVSVHTVRSWIQRDSVPAEHWVGFVRDGQATFEQFAVAAADRSARPLTHDRKAAAKGRARKVTIKGYAQSDKAKAVGA